MTYRRVNAVDAVRCATGGLSHPFVRIDQPLDGASFAYGASSMDLRAEADDAEDGTNVTVRWTSDRDGLIGTTIGGATLFLGPQGLSIGDHRITATATDSTGLSMIDAIDLHVTNPPPVFTIVQPGPGTPQFHAGQTIQLFGTSSDPNETPAFGPLDDDQVRWFRDTC